MTRFTLIETPLGVAALAWRDGRILRVRLPHPTAAETEAALLCELPDAVRAPAIGREKSVAERLRRHLSGSPQAYDDVALDLDTVPAFHRSVYEHTRAIASGRTVTYGQLAALAGRPGGARAVGQAMAKNRFPVVVPCHRVVAANRKPGGFSASGGLDTKAKLLAIEGVELARPEPTLFSGGRSLDFDPSLALRHLRDNDPTLARLIDRVGPFLLQLGDMRTPYEALGQSILFQQLTGKAASTILGRLRTAIGGGTFPRPEVLLAASDEALRATGVSGPKIAALRDLAAHARDRKLPSVTRLETMDDEAIIDAFCGIRGIGRWTVEMLLIFRLGRPDVLPVTDYGVRKGFAAAWGLPELPTPKALLEYGDRWRPFRSVASWYLWRASELPPER